MTAPDARGHRKRLWKRVIENGLRGGLPHAYEKLEWLLTMVLPRVDTKPMARALLKRFGSLNGVFNAPIHRLREIEGVGERAAHFLASLGELGNVLDEEYLARRNLLNHPERVRSWVQRELAWQEAEHLLVVFLDKRGRLLGQKRLLHGTLDKVPHYPREVTKAALAHNAAGVILAHNHPSGRANPSQRDIMATRELKAALELVGVSLQDHLVVGKEAVTSFLASGLLDEV